jgi:HTH-type transcriptional regulator/antitoxin HipB
MSTDHESYEQIARRRRGSAQFREGNEEAGRTFLIGQAVRERRLALSLSQTEVAAWAGMTQPALSRLEAGGTVPTIPVLDRIDAALGAKLIVTIAPPAA